MEGIYNAKNRLISFMAEMCAWENETAKLYDDGGPEKHGEAAGQHLSLIYQKYLTNRDRKYGRLPIPNARFPTEYDPKQEAIESVETISNNKLLIVTNWTHPVVPSFCVKYSYTLVFENGEWWIDSKKKYSPSEDKWKKIVF